MRRRIVMRCTTILAVAFSLYGGAPALAQAPPATPACDGMVEVRLVNPTNTRSPFEPNRDPATFPQAVLRLPRAGTYVPTVEVKGRWLRAGCEPATVTAILADTQNVGGWATRFGIPYHDFETAQRVGFRLPYSPSLPPVDDSADRAGFAARGAWVVEQPHRTDWGSARFCLLPPAPPNQCYASWGAFGMSYITGGLIVDSRVFTLRSLWQTERRRLITTADLDRHFAFLRALTDAAVVQMPAPASK